MKMNLILSVSTSACCVLMALASYAQPNFINQIPIPPLLDAAQGTIELEVEQLLHKFNPGDTSDHRFNGSANQAGIPSWAYNQVGSDEMTILGPTLLWTTGAQTDINVTNNISQPTTVHWHGAEIPALIDGGPHDSIAPGEVWPVNFIDLDSSSTMWYHPHMHNNTFPQVQMGLSGMVISRETNDPINAGLPNYYGIDDIPIIIGDLNLDSTLVGSVYEYKIDTIKGKRPYNMVNGVMNPYVRLRPHMVRLRVLNGSSRKGMQIGFSTGANDPVAALIDFYQVATDGGYTLLPDVHKTLLLGPGERVELVIDLTSQTVGSTLYMRNLKELMPGYIVGSPNPTTGPGGGQDGTIGSAFLEIRVVADTIVAGYTPVDSAPSFTSNWDPAIADTFGITGVRTKVLMNNPFGAGFVIDSTTFAMDTINDIICLNAKEIWKIKNVSAVAHPFHIHKIFFRILKIDSLHTNGTITPVDLVARGLNGPKDDILVLPNWTVHFLAKFDDYPSDIHPHDTYMYHCHILTHEDSEGGGMMHQFVVTDQGPCLVTELKEQESNGFKMYPNPAQDQLFIEVQTAGRMRIIDVQGKVVIENQISSSSGAQQIDLRKLNKGFYVVEWSNGEQTFTRKLVLD